MRAERGVQAQRDRAAVFAVLTEAGAALTNRELRARTGLSYYAVDVAISELRRRGHLEGAGLRERSGPVPPGSRRRERLYRLVPSEGSQTCP